AEPSATNYFELLALGQNLGGDLGGRADGQALVVADDRAQLGGLQAGLEIDVAAALGEDLYCARGKLIGDEHLGLCHENVSSKQPHPEEARSAVSNARGKPRVGGPQIPSSLHPPREAPCGRSSG